MALFGFHMVVTLVAASIFNKLVSRFSFCDTLVFKGLRYYLLEGSLLPKPNKNNNNEFRQRRKRTSRKDSEPPEDRLLSLPLTANALQGVPFFDSLVWTINYSLVSILVYIVSDLFCFFFPDNKDLNTSLIWILCALILQIHVIMRIAYEKVSAKELFPERNTLICALGFFFLGSMLLNAFCDKIMDINFSNGYIHLVDSLNSFVQSKGFKPLFSESARSPLLFLVSLSFLYSIIATAFFFPVMQYASLYMDSLENCDHVMRFLLHMSFVAPFGIILLFLRPVVELIKGEILPYEQFDVLRICAIFIWALLRCATAKVCIQTFLDEPKRKILEYRNERLKDEDCQRKVANFASYSCTTALQYYMPVLIILSTTLSLKYFGNIELASAWEEKAQLPIDEAPNFNENNIQKIIFAADIQQPIWMLTLITFFSAELFISMLGVLGRRTFL